MNLKKWSLLVMAAMFMTGCGGAKVQAPPPPPQPTHVILEFEASPDMNPNLAGNPSPTVVKIYELKSSSDFDRVDFLALYQDDKGALGGNLLSKEEIDLKPGEKKTVHIQPSDSTLELGFFAVFRVYDKTRWRDTITIRPHETTVVPVRVGAAGIRLQ